MFDLSKGPYALKAQSVSAFLSSLEETLPAHMEITLKQVTLKKGGKTPAIQVRDGLWRGASLVILDTNKQLALGGIYYKVPTFAAKAIVFIGMCAAFSLIFTILASAMLGQFAPVGMGGGVVGAMISGNIDNMIAKRLRDSPWSSELKDAIETVNA
jgi:hypothetical protein